MMNTNPIPTGVRQLTASPEAFQTSTMMISNSRMRTPRLTELKTLISTALIALTLIPLTANAQTRADVAAKNGFQSVATDNALEFDGVNDYLRIPYQSAMNVQDAFTFETWVYLTGGNHAGVFNRDSGGSGVGLSYSIIALSDGRLEFEVLNSDYIQSDPGEVARDEWEHIAITYDESASPKLTMYVNGDVVKTADTGVSAGSLNPGDVVSALLLGNSSRGHYLDGSMDDARIWSTARTEAEIEHGMTNPLVGNEDDLVAFWRFDAKKNLGVNNDGTDDIQDHSGSELHGDVVGDGGLIDSTVPKDAALVSATDDLFEDKVLVEWEIDEDADPAFLQIVRDGRLLAVLPGSEDEFEDLGVEVNLLSIYCVVSEAGDGTRTVLGCDGGRRRHLEVTDVEASDLLYTDRVVVTWNDRSIANDGYRVLREGSEIGTTGGNIAFFEDTTALINTEYEYCVVPLEGIVEGAPRVCDIGSRGEILPVLVFQASDGTHPNFVNLEWTDQGEGVTGFEIRRDFELIQTADPSDDSYEDRDAVSGREHTYCVRRLTALGSSVDICEAGGMGTLGSPTNFAAENGIYDDRTGLSWRDPSDVEDGFNVYRTGGSALNFDGSDDEVTVLEDPLLDLDEMSVEAWVYPESIGPAVKTIVNKGSSRNYSLLVLSTGHAHFAAHPADCVSPLITLDGPILPVDEWSHMAATYDGSTMRLYVNGEEVQTAANANGLCENDDDITIGGGTFATFDGSIDEIRLWNEARSEEDIQDLMHEALEGTESGLTGYWPLDEGTGSRADDGFGIHAGSLENFDLSVSVPGWHISQAPIVQHGSGLAINLDGADDQLEIPDNNDLALLEFTVEGWLNPASYSGGDDQVVIAKQELSGSTNYAVTLLGTGELELSMSDATCSATAGTLTSLSPIPIDQWTHFAFTHTEDESFVFVNGHIEASITVGEAICTNAADLSIGGGGVAATVNFDGEMDDIRLWNIARPESDLVNGFRQEPEDETGLVFHLNFDSRSDSGIGNGGFNDVSKRAGAVFADMIGDPSLVRGRPFLISSTAADITQFQDFDGLPNVLFEYCVATFTWDGVETALSCDTGFRSPVISVADLDATDGDHENQVVLTWSDPSTRTSIFKIYREGTLKQTLSSTILTYADTEDLESDVEYEYCIVSVSSDGTESESSCDEGHRSLNPATAVAATDNSYEHRVAVSWTDNSDIERGYRVYRRLYTDFDAGTLAGDSVLVKETLSNVISADDSEGIPGSVYRYSVIPYDDDGRGEAVMNDGERRIIPPSNVEADDDLAETEVAILWVDVSTAETGYRIFRNDVEIAEVAKNQTQYVDTNPSFGATSTYGVEAFDDYGESTRTEDDGSTILLEPGTVDASNYYTDRVSISWVDQSSVETGYRINRDGTLLVDVGADVTSYIDTSPVASAVHTYCVMTRSAVGTSGEECDTGMSFTPPPAGTYTALDDTWVAPDESQYAQFGISVTTAGDQMMVGALFDVEDRGSVYVYERTAAGWEFKQKLVASDSQEGARFGETIDMTSSWAIIGSPVHLNTHGSQRQVQCCLGLSYESYYGRIYFFKRTPDGWEESQAYTHDYLGLNGGYGRFVATDGNYAIIGADEGSLYIQERQGDTWVQTVGIGGQTVVSGGIASDLAVFGGIDAGKGYFQILSRSGTEWSLGAQIDPYSIADGGDTFGRATSVWNKHVAVGGSGLDALGVDGSGIVEIWRVDDPDNPVKEATLYASDLTENLEFGKSVSLEGNDLIVGAIASAYHFRSDGNGNWTQIAKYKSEYLPDSWSFGRSVYISQEGVIAVGDPNESSYYASPDETGGRVYLLEPDPADPSDVAASDGDFQNRVELSWSDNSDDENGFNVIRDGEVIEVTATDITSYIDKDAIPGNVHQYCVQAIKTVYGNVSGESCDLGWRFPDGSISGQIIASAGVGVQDIDVCLDPTPNGGLNADGYGGHAYSSDTTELPDSFTLEFWARRSASASGQDVVFSHGEGSANEGLWGGFNASGNIVFGFLSNDLVGPTVSDDAWHHYAMSYNSSSNVRLLYVDGIEVADDVSASDYLGDGSFYVGSLHGSDFFEGMIDEIRLWNHVVPESFIQGRLSTTIDPTAPDLGLFAHWSLDERGGEYSANDVDLEGSFFLGHNTGIHPSRPAAPLTACDRTDTNGNWAFSGIRYGESTEFTLLPQDPGEVIRSFAPARKAITLSRENPIQNEVEFIDLTRYNVSGIIEFDGTTCRVPNIPMHANGEARGGTDSDGAFRLALDPGQTMVEPKVSGEARVFDPPFVSFDLDEDTFGVNFVDETIRTLSGNVVGTGLCKIPIGVASLRIQAENGCFTTDIDTDSNGFFEIDLPPMPYIVTVLDVDNAEPSRRTDILEYFDDLGPQLIDITDADSLLDFIYRPGLTVTIDGLSPSMCNTADIPDNLPILTKGDPLPLSITVVEDLGGGDTCAVDEATISLFSEITDQAKEALILEIGPDDGGVVDTTLVVGAPNPLSGRVIDGINRSHQKFITAIAEVDAQSSTVTEWAVVEGARPRPGGQFVTIPEAPIATMVLRDPPGDHSYAYAAEGTEVCSEFMLSAALEVRISNELIIAVQPVVDLGVAFGGEASAVLVMGDRIIGTISASLTQTVGGGVELCTTVDEEIRTSPDEDWFGPPADVFVGTGLNFIFARADRVAVDECKIEVDDTIAFGPSLDTAFMFTRRHIEDVMVPTIEDLRDRATAADSISQYNAGINNWQRMIASADSVAALEGLEPFKDDSQNISFNAGADFSMERGSEEEGFLFTETVLELGLGLFWELRYEFAGVGIQNTLGIEAIATGTFGFEQTWNNHRAFGFELSDDDVGDNYTVDVFEDPEYGTAIFDVKAGLSSCPYEPWAARSIIPGITGIVPRTVSRDAPTLSINPPLQLGVDPNEKARFTLGLGNLYGDDTDPFRNYRLAQLRSSNPGGAVFEAGGTTLGTATNALDFQVPFLQQQELELTLTRGPNRYDYTDLGLVLYPVCEEGNLDRGNPNVADTLRFSVQFTAPCSDISLFRPKENWTLTREGAEDPMEIIFNDFTLADNDVDPGVQRIALEYRLAGTSDWLPAMTISRSTIVAQGGEDADSYTGEWDFNGPDGVYELRAYTECDSGRTYSDIVQGIVDTELPEIIGLAEPADELLALGDEISVTFNEAMACSSIIFEGGLVNTTLTRLDTDAVIPIGAVCDGTLVTLAPQDSNLLEDLEGIDLRVDMEAWEDLAGNPMEGDHSWTFNVRRRAFTWSPSAVAMTTPLGSSGNFEATLVNGKLDPVEFELSDYDDWLIPNLISGEIAAHESATIGFTVESSLSVGEHITTVLATTALGTSALEVSVEVIDACLEPSWAVTPSNFQHNMTLTGQLYLDGFVSVDGDDVVGAFVGNSLRGVTPVTPVDRSDDGDDDGNLVNLVIYSNIAAGEQVQFQVWDASECALHEETGLSLAFEANEIHGTPLSPVTLQAPPPEAVPGSIALNSGWTWFSINIDPTDSEVNAMLGDLPAVSGDIIKSQTQFSLYEPGLGWIGTLTEVDPTEAYLIKLGQSTVLDLEGTEVNTTTTTIDVVEGWNWVPFLPQDEMPVDEALESLTATTNDIIKSQYQFAQYVDGIGWIGSLTSMEPGLGYLLKSQAAGELDYPETSAPFLEHRFAEDEAMPQSEDIGYVSAKMSVMPTADVGSLQDSAVKDVDATPRRFLTTNDHSQSISSSGLACTIQPADFQHTMTLTAMAQIDGADLRSDSGEIGLFHVNGDVAECRGFGTLQHIPSTDQYLAFVVVYSNDPGEELTFQVFDAVSDAMVLAADVLTFESNAVVGSVTEPFVVHGESSLSTSTEEGPLPMDFALSQNYPNPFRGTTVIEFALPQSEVVEITLFDVLGRRVNTLFASDASAGYHEVKFDTSRLAPGTYTYRMKAGSFSETKVMTLLR